MKHLYVFYGKGRCSGAVAYVLGTDEKDATVRLLRDDSCEFFDIDRVEPFMVLV